MGRACCVLGCSSGGDVPSHQIPKNPVLFQKWKSMIYSEKIQHLTDEQISKCAVCYRHFADDDYLVTFRVRKLKRGIAPSLNLPNKPTSNIPNVIKVESQISAANTSMFVTKEVTESQKIKGVEATQIALFEDVPEQDQSCVFNQAQILSDEHTEQTNSTTETFKLNRSEKMSKKKVIKLINTVHLSLLRCRQQAKQYEKTPTIQKLLSFLTSAEITFIKSKIQKSKYSPKVYVRIYHNIAKRKALGQL